MPMTLINRPLIDRHAPLILLLASVGILATAFAFEHLGGLAPCELCWWQRYVLMAAIPVAALAVLLDRTRPGAAVGLLVLLGVIFLCGIAVAGYHLGVEQGWWQGPTACSATPLGDDLDAMFRDIMAAPVARCDEVAWSLFGLSMAGYNLALSAGLTALAFRAAWIRSRRVALSS